MLETFKKPTYLGLDLTKYMLNKPNIVNIPNNYHFLKSLFHWLENSFSEELPHVKIFLPNRRSCREFSRLFLDKKSPKLLPEIKAISDLSYEDFFEFLPNKDAQEAINELLEIKTLSKMDYLLLLSQEIQKLSLFGENLDFEQSFKIAINLQSLFDDIESEEVDFEQISDIDDSNLSKHRQITMDFLKEFYVKVKNSSLKNNTLFSGSSQNLIIHKFIQLLDQFHSKTPIIIAGSTGSVSFVKKLIKAISKDNYVVLYGANKESFSEENHPQFFPKQLTDFLEINPKDIPDIIRNEFALSDQARQELLSLMMLPSHKTQQWQKVSNYLDVSRVKKDLEDNFTLIEANNEIEESKLIALIAQEACQNNKDLAIIANNDKVATLIALELQKINLPFNDARSFKIFNSKVINFLLSILELIESDFNSHNILAVLKNPLCVYATRKELLTRFEISILREDRIDKGIIGITSKLKSHKELEKFFAEFTHILSAFDSSGLASQSLSLIKIIEDLTQESWQNLLIQEAAQIEIFELFEKLKHYQDIQVSPKNLSSTYKTLFSQINYFNKSSSEVPIQILSTIEARLLNHNLIIISSLNEGDFPKMDSENWLGKKIKKDLKIDKTLKKIGQNAYDFCNYLSNESVVLTRSCTMNGTTIIESPFLLKFKTICKKIDANIANGQKYLRRLEKNNSPKLIKAIQPNPKPAINLRPTSTSITEISKLLANPYDIYAKKILGLKKLNKIDFEPSYAEFGSFIHEALEEFVKNPEDNNKEDIFIKKSYQIFQNYFITNEASLIWWPKFENIFADFTKENQALMRLKNHVELSASIEINNHKIRGKIDRVSILEDGSINITDYKTGQVATKKDVLNGVDPQLTLSALMILEGITNLILEKNEVSSLHYWKLSSSSTSEIKKICTKSEEINILIAAAKSGLEKLFEHFANKENGYIATESEKRTDYTHLIRKEEWSD